MYKAQLYSKYNLLQRRDAAYVLDKFSNLIKWQPNEKVLDIGCGDGRVTSEVILPHLPKHFEKLVGLDLSPEMIKFNNETRKFPKVYFRQFDITTKQLPESFKEEFHHIFSFYCLNWVQDQKKSFENIYDIMKPGGSCLVTILGYNPVYTAYQGLLKYNKWAPYMKNFDKFLSPYHYSKNAGKEVEELINQIGFTVHYCKVEKMHYKYPSLDNLKQTITAVNPFIRNMSDNEVKEYFNDFCTEMKKLGNVTVKRSNNYEESVEYFYELLIVYASKSDKIIQ